MKKEVMTIFLFFITYSLYGCRLLTLEGAVEVYALRTKAAQIGLLRLKNESLSYINYKQSFLPAFYFNAELFDFNHSLRLLQNAMDGNYFNIEDFSGSSSIELSIQQKVFHTGGSLSLNSGHSFLREYSANRNNFISMPFYVSYTQPFWGGRRLNMIERRINEWKYKSSLTNYCSAISLIQQEVLHLYLTSFLSLLEKEQTYSDVQISDTLFQIARFKYEKGYITEFDLNQIELQFLNSKYLYENALSLYGENIRKLSASLNINEEINIDRPDRDKLPHYLDEDIVGWIIERNNPLYVNNFVRREQAEYDLFKKNLETRFNGSFSVNYGLNQYAETFKGAFMNPNSQQNVAISLSIPIFQWGINRNKREMARNEYEMALLEIEKSEESLINEKCNCIYDYNCSVRACEITERTYILSRKQYHLAVQKFAMGKISVYELTSMKQNQYTAMQQYYDVLRDLYVNYYKLRHLTLYDFVRMKPLREVFAI